MSGLNEAEILNLVAEHPLFRVLEPTVLRSIVRASKLVSYRAKRTVLREGEAPDHAFSLLKGAVRVFHRSGESEVLLKLFRAPAFFGEMEVLAERPFMEYVHTLEPSELLLIPAPLFRHVVRTQPALAVALSLDLAARLCISAHNQKALAFCDVETRLANLLLDYAEFFGEKQGEEIRLNVPLSQDSMARDLAVTRKALAHALTKFRDEDLVSKENARFVLKNTERLKERGMGTLRLSYRIDKPLPSDAPPRPSMEPEPMESGEDATLEG
jgi:CRP-like cAMP-binding protein